jgi:hypothetical protein
MSIESPSSIEQKKSAADYYQHLDKLEQAQTQKETGKKRIVSRFLLASSLAVLSMGCHPEQVKSSDSNLPTTAAVEADKMFETSEQNQTRDLGEYLYRLDQGSTPTREQSRARAFDLLTKSGEKVDLNNSQLVFHNRHGVPTEISYNGHLVQVDPSLYEAKEKALLSLSVEPSVSVPTKPSVESPVNPPAGPEQKVNPEAQNFL